MKKIIILAILFPVFLAVQGQSLEEFQRLAAENNPGLQAKYSEFEAAMQEAAQVGSLPDPTLSFGYFISPVETRVGPQRARFSLNQMFPWFGSLSAQGDASALMARAKYQRFIDARNKLFYEVAKNYYSISELGELLEIQAEYISILESYKTIANGKYENNKSSMVDVIRADIKIREAQTEYDILNKKRKPLEANLNLLLNREPNRKLQINDSLRLESVNFIPPESDSLFKNHPQLEGLNLKAEAMTKKEKAVLKQGYPSFGVGVDYVMVDERSDADLSDNGKDAIMPMVSVSLPIFRGKYKAAREQARILHDIYQKEQEEKSNDLRSAYEQAKFETEENREKIELYRTQIEQAESALNLLYSSYSNQGSEFEELLRMQQQLLNYKKMKLNALRELYITRAKINYITAKNNQDANR